MAKALICQAKVRSKSAGWLQDQGYYSLSSHRSWLNEYHKLLGTEWLKVNCLFTVGLQNWDSWTSSIKQGHHVLIFSCKTMFLYSLQAREAYLEPTQTFMMELFSEKSKSLTIFIKPSHHRLYWVIDMPQIRAYLEPTLNVPP